MPARRVLFALAAICAANLLLEVALTRLLSALMFYHFAFLVIAVALLGMGASGVWLYVSGARSADTALADMATAARRFALATVLVVVYVLANPIAPYVGVLEAPKFTNITLLQLVLLCAVAALPFFYAGLVVSLAITHFRDRVDRIYAWDLCGAGLAALLVGPAIGVLGAPSLVVAAALLGCIAAALFAPTRLNLGAPAAGTLLLALSLTTGLFAMPSTKSMRAERVVFDRWNTFSHVTVEKMAGDDYDILIDSAARTPVAHARNASASDWMVDITALGYTLHPGGAGSALVIGPGGGIDLARALASGVKHATAVDINPLIATDVMRGQFEAPSGGLYRDPRISVVVAEGRSYVRRTDARFQVIQLSLVDTWAATASGAFALTENSLYTVEAFQDYYAHLSDDGILAVTRWWTFLSGPESKRLTLLGAGALEEDGIRPGQTRRHLYLAGHDHFATLLVKKTPFSTDELRRLDEWCLRLGHRTLLSPTVDNEPELVAMVDAGAWSARVRAAPQDLTPPTDDRNFFFYFVKPGQLFGATLESGRITNPAAWLLGALGAVLLAMTLAFVFLPLVGRRWSELGAGGTQGNVSRRLLGLGYFAAIGFAFMVIEMALIQRLSLLLGHPSYSLVVVLFGILIGTAGGARLSSRFTARPDRGTALGGMTVAVLAVVAGVALGDVVRGLITLALPVRMSLAAAIVVCFGLAMGLMLPLGLRLLARRDDAFIPWAWGINGGMSVLGTVSATVIAVSWGFGVTFYVGAAFYALAAGIGVALTRRTRTRA